MIREDRELLAQLARLNGDMAPLAMQIMEGSASAAHQHQYAQRLIAAGQRLQRRADQTGGMVIEGQPAAEQQTTFPANTVERSREP